MRRALMIRDAEPRFGTKNASELMMMSHACVSHTVFLCASLSCAENLARVGGQAVMDSKPENGAKILIFKDAPLRMILDGRKTVEVRHAKYKAGIYWLGSKGIIHGIARLGPGTLVESNKDWERLRDQHLMQTASPPYPRTYLFEILACERRKLPFRHTRGAIGIVRYRRA